MDDAGGPIEFSASGPLRGTARIPGDKSISHRALICAAMARGRSRIEGLSESEDVRATAAALRAMGVRIERDGGAWTVDGVGSGGLLQPQSALDMVNSGTSARLLMGLVASHPIVAIFTGDSSLSRRPMERVAAPLRRIGAEVRTAPGGRLPLTVRGLCPAVPATHWMEVPSAQVKSALLLAALNIPGLTRIVEPVPTRDHSERMLRQFGADLVVEGEEIVLRGETELEPRSLAVPGDPSAAAFLAVAAAIIPGSELIVEGVGINPRRAGLFELLRAMGADLAWSNPRDVEGEPVADLAVRHSGLRGIEVPPDIAPRMIDEFPIFFVAAAFAEGTTRARGLGELRVKESDRLATMGQGLRAIGARVEEGEDGLVIAGTGGAPLPGGATIDPRLDHRIAMSFAVAGLHCREPVTLADMTIADTSFPGFAALLEGLSR
ncbi:MAG: 3-phosphoshikimate 1-carboxyvinyltransferase [Sphingomonadales bacterium]|jgi:3-phosphoshikimate 1-carboxyvinyltransferase|nr:3-phosphoshikimate 1-carboxyvinyltransferase [Sphingomonadales bacterium]